MKYIFTLILIIVLNSCKTTNASKFVSNLNKEQIKLNASDCPENIKCTTEILKNKDYTIEKDGIGKTYPKIVDGDKTVIRYTYQIKNENNYTDGNQSEVILFVIDKETQTELQDKDLQNVKMLFGKNCFCRDIQGFYKVTKGSFILNNSEITIYVNIPKLGKRQILEKVHLTLE